MLEAFLKRVDSLQVIVSTLIPEDREGVVTFLLKLKAPVYLEAISGIREDPRMQHLRVFKPQIKSGILRIGGVPTHRLWRDLEDRKEEIEVLCINHLPFKGLSHGEMLTTSLSEFFMQCDPHDEWEISRDTLYGMKVRALLKEETLSEPGMLNALLDLISEQSLVYLGNSLPIRQWDLAAGMKRFNIQASRGVNGIDGQISTFLGMCEPDRENWAIIGDLTALYDLAGPWIFPQLEAQKIAIVVINNGGGKIFDRMYASKTFQNQHKICFESLAKFWSLEYERWNAIPKSHTLRRPQLIEVIPDDVATQRFWKAFA